jgi:hypothetical protein
MCDPHPTSSPRRSSSRPLGTVGISLFSVSAFGAEPGTIRAMGQGKHRAAVDRRFARAAAVAADLRAVS